MNQKAGLFIPPLLNIEGLTNNRLGGGMNELFVIINLLILGLNIKLYTEILKEKSQRNRKKEKP